MLTPSYLLCVSAVCVLAASTGGRVSAAGEFCHGWLDRRSARREGFYCPESGDKLNAVICCGMCDYRYCCSDSSARLDQGTCADRQRDRDRKAPNREAAQADNNEYPVYIPFLIVGSAFLALLIFGGSAYLLYNRQSARSEPEEAVSTATTAMTTRAPCGSASSLAAHGDQPRRNHGNQPPANQDAALALRGPLANENAAVTMRRPLVPPTHPCAHCSGLANQHAGPPVNQTANQSHAIHRYPLSSQPPPPPLYMPIVLPHLPLPLPPHDQDLDQPPPRHFHTHPQITHPLSRALPPPQYATMPPPQGHHERPPPPLSPRPKLPSSPFDAAAAAPQLPPPFMHGYIMTSQHHTHGPFTTHTHTPYANLRIPSPPPRLTHTHHAVL